MSIGLKRGTVRLEPHQTSWADLFQQEKAKLWAVLSAYPVEIEHVGSTAIQGIDAKPILDILLGLPDLTDELGIRSLLEGMGYLYRGEQGVPERILYVKGAETNRTHHLHITAYKSLFWLENIYFRDTLNAKPEVARAYNDLKQELAAQYADDRAAYTAGKKAFIERVLQTRTD
jgi:GrpB-like predicted nucleotidyltransferase (UPF0157 family)